MGLVNDYPSAKARFRVSEGTKEWIVRWWPRATSVVLTVVLLLAPFLKVWLNLAEFGASFGGAGEVTTFHYIEIALVAQWTLTAMSLPGLFKRKVWGWNAICCSRITGVGIALLAISNVTRAADGQGLAIVAAYILFQIFKTYILIQVRPLYQ